MKPLKIVYIGAGSLAFGPKLVSDAVLTPEIKGAHLVLMDIDAAALERNYRLTQKMNEINGNPLQLEQTTDRRQALQDADFVLISTATKRFEHWKHDMEIPQKYGIYQTKAETGGPGGISLILRNMPVLVDICRDVEQLAPNAWVLNYTNPVNAMMYGINRYTNVKWIGLCDGIFEIMDRYADLFDTPRENLDFKPAGINHCIWTQSLYRKDTGEDLLGQLPEKLAARPDVQPLSQYLYRLFGLFPGPSDSEVGEFFAFGREFLEKPGFIYEERIAHKKKYDAKIRRMLDGSESLGQLGHVRSPEIALDFMVDKVYGRELRRPSGIVENLGNIPNLPFDAIVEVPIVVDSGGLQPLKMPSLPDPLARYLTNLIQVQQLAVEAAMTGSRKLALTAMLLEPSAKSARDTEKMLEELLETHRSALPDYWFK